MARLGDPLSGSQQLGRGPAYVELVNRASGAVLANVGCGYEGADIALAVGTGSPCQQWRPDDRDGGYVSLGNRFSNKVAEVAGCVNADGARVAQWGWLANACQEYRFVRTDNGWLQVQNRLAGRVLAPAGCGGAGALIQTVTPTGAGCEQFRVAPVGGVLIADGTGQRTLSCGRTVGTSRRTGSCQQWRFVPTTDGYYRIVNVHTGRPLGTLRTGGPTLAGHAAEWRIEPGNDGTYLLVDRAGDTLGVSGQPAPVRLLAP
ncbi:MAG TPA: RICIN domain-containing protein [Mycobacteriales bacterium]|nr:RICIN domain-containing protein [Mycobacteriales bacterium]